jgi:hypothetical protein
MSETNTTTLEPTTETIKVRKPRTRKPTPEHIKPLKVAVTKVLKTQWLYSKAIQKHAIAVKKSELAMAEANKNCREAFLQLQEVAAFGVAVHSLQA